MSILTAGDICSKAAQMTGAYGAGQTLSSDDGQLLLDLLNAQQDMWSNWSLACYEVLEQSGSLVINQQSYTIGSGGNFNMTRPLGILQGPGTAYTQDANGNNYPIEVVPRDKWNLYANRSSVVTANFPYVMFYDPQFPLGVINVFPVPNQVVTMFWDSYLQLSQFASLSTNINLPPGYALAMMTNLAVLAKPFFLDGQMDPVIPEIASASLGTIKRTNMRPVEALYDPEIVARANIGYNPWTDTVGSVITTN